MPGAKAVTAGEERALLERNDSATSSVDDDVNAASDEQTPSPDNATKESDVTINCADETIDVSDKSANTDEDELRDEDTNGVSICTESVAPPDGGWGWMVTVAGFVVTLLFQGVVGSFGLLMPALGTTFGSSVSLTTLAPSVFVATNLLSGPAAACLVQRFGCRMVALCGGVIASLGFSCAAYCPNIESFIFFYGVVSGVGAGLVYLPCITMSNLYFDRKRGAVAGIFASGSGVGLLVLAQLTEVWMEEYGWRGCNLLMGSLTLNYCVCACLLRPLPMKYPNHSHKNASHGKGSTAAEVKRPPHSDVGRFVDHGKEEFQHYDYHTQLGNLVKNGADGFSLVSVETITDADSDYSRSARAVSVWSSLKNVFLGDAHLGGSHAHIAERPRYHQLLRENSVSMCHIASPARNTALRGFSTWLAAELPPSLSHHSVDKNASHRVIPPRRKPVSSSNIFSALSHLDTRKVNQFQSEPKMESVSVVAPSVTRRIQGLCSEQKTKPGPGFGSVHGLMVTPIIHASSLHQQTNLLTVTSRDVMPPPTIIISSPTSGVIQSKHDLNVAENAMTGNDDGYKETDTSSSSSSTESTISDEPGFTNCDRPGAALTFVTRHRGFVLFLAGAFLVQLVSQVPSLFTPSYAYLHGVGNEQVAQIISVFGILNTVGRLGSGLLVYWGCGSLRVHNLGVLLGGVACFAFPFCTTFPTITTCLALHGLFMGAGPPLQAVILVEYLGVERLASVFGFLGFVKAFACLAGAPLAGAVYTLTGLYTTPVVGCGAVLILAAVTHQLMAFCSRPADHDDVSDSISS
ncbi:hypothetical protein BaRGS_00005988 [Batillaria attramentaria]|uniref:Major facilitator superfamily (MFS) profile domain-containing protein n=1 Tax=Batillaria attramentaria TaxID=370345 RepID=A0ABD0LU69_9CAEN